MNLFDRLVRRPSSWLYELLLKFFRWVGSKIPDWIKLRSLGQNKALKSSYVWFFFVPICSKLLQHLPDPIKISLPGLIQSSEKGVSLTLSLPFTWQVMFFASVAFSLASALFAWRCPPLIRDFVSPGDFISQGRVPFHIWQFVGEAREKELPQHLVDDDFVLQRNFIQGFRGSRKRGYQHDTDKAMKDFWAKYVPVDNDFNIKLRNEYYEEQQHPERMMMDDEYHIPNTPWHSPIAEDHFKMLFHGARVEMQGMHFRSRLFCAIFYALGFLAILILACQNIWAVWCLTFR